MVGTVTHIKHLGGVPIITDVATWRMMLIMSIPYAVRQEPAMQWLFLSIAIINEVFATSALKSSNGFTQLWPSLVVVAGYAAAFFFLSLTLRTIRVGIAYAICLAPASCLSRLLPGSFSGRHSMAPPCSDWRLSSLA